MGVRVRVRGRGELGVRLCEQCQSAGAHHGHEPGGHLVRVRVRGIGIGLGFGV